MADSGHAFDAQWLERCSRQFAGRSVVREVSIEQGRQLFHLLQQPVMDSAILQRAFGFLGQALQAAEHAHAALLIEDYAPEKLAALPFPRIEALPERLLQRDNLHYCIDQSAAVILTQPRWLERICQACFSETGTAVQLMSIYLRLSRGEGRQEPELSALYLALLSTAGIEPPLLHSSEYSCRADLQAEMFDFAAVQLALARLPRLLFPELLGFTIAYCQFPTLLEVCCPGRQLDAPFFRQRQRRIDKQLPLLQDCIRQYLELFPGQQQALWRRLQKGCWLYCHQMRCSRDGLFRVLDAPLSPSQAFARLLQQKAAAALGHHRKIQLQGTSLEGWFAGLPANSREFLQALRDSRYVDGSNPAESRLLQLFEADGPMFGVLDAQERDRVRDWLQHGSVRAEPAFERETEMTAGVDPPAGHSTVRVGRRSVSGRELYYQLVNGDLFPDAAQQARHRVKRLLQASALCHPAPFRQYSHARFDAFADRHGERSEGG